MAENPRAPDRAVEAGRGAIFIGAAKIFFIVSGFIQQLLLPRLLGTAGFGDYGVVSNAAVSVLNNATVQGTINSVSKFTAEDDAPRRRRQAGGAEAAGDRRRPAGAGVLRLAPRCSPGTTSIREFTPLFRIVALIPLLYSLYSVFVGSANGLRRFRAQAGFDISFSTTKTSPGGGGCGGRRCGRGAWPAGWSTALLVLILSAVVMRLPRRDQAAGAFPMRPAARPSWAGSCSTPCSSIWRCNWTSCCCGGSPALGTAATQASELERPVSGRAHLRAAALSGCCLAITFVIFPLVSRSTFEQDREATRVYVTQTLRYAIILSGAVAAVVVARPAGLLTLVYPAAFRDGAPALPVLVAGIVCLSLMGVSGSIINASGRLRATILLTALTVVVGHCRRLHRRAGTARRGRRC